MEAVNGVSEADKGGPTAPSPLTGCYLLIVVGEPHSKEHKDIILRRIAKGLLSWDASDCHVDLEKELAIITEQAPEGEDARYGERLIQFASENLVTEILIHPAISTLSQCMKNLLSSFTRHRHVIHAGYTFAANGSWILQDGTFSLTDFSEAFQEMEVQRVLRAYDNSISLDIHCSPEGDWTRLPKETFTKNCKVRVNPDDVLTSGSPAIVNFLNYTSPFLLPTDIETLLESSDVVGNIRFSHPTLYVFPGGQGDAALFGINGFNMLVDGGFARKACFWDFVRHLDRLDAVLLTRLNNSNVNGISSVLRRKRYNTVYPQLGHFFCNIQERKSILSPDGDKDKDPLLINLLEEGHEIVSNLRQLNLQPQMCYRDVEPINLYHKVGHGTLDMYVLSPAKESKEVREFLQKWNTNDQRLFANQKNGREFSFPTQNLVSICALLVWQPASTSDNITRILFPGSTPQHKIFEGLDRLKQLECIKHPTCSAKTLTPSLMKSKQSKAEKILQHEQKENKTKEKLVQQAETKGKLENKIADENIKNVQSNGVANEQIISEKIIKKHDSTESEKSGPQSGEVKKQEGEKDVTSLVNGKSTDEKNIDKAKAKPKPDQKSKVEAKVFKHTRSIERKPKPTTEKKASPTTPKKTLNGETKPKTTMKVSPSATPAKSTKEANNRKVVESKYKVAPKKETPKPEKKEVKERKPISRRPKGTSPTGKAPESPIKKPTELHKVEARKPKLEKEGTTDSSTVSTPSADVDTAMKKDLSKLTPEELEQLKARELAELKEEQEVVKEIEAVFQKSEQKVTDNSDVRKVKNISVDDKTEGEGEEYLIIEKEEIEHDSLDEKDIKESETQKHLRDSEESEKQRKLSGEIAIEIKEEVPIEVAEIIEPLKAPVEVALPSAKIKDEKEQPKELSKEISVTSPDEKVDVSSGKKVTDRDVDEENKEANILESQPDEKFSTPIESGATTAPTLPEDERIPLDEIKEDNKDQAIEEKYVKEDTKEKEIPVVHLPPKTTEAMAKLPTVVGIRLDKQTPIRDLVKTPDEVADLPVHEEVDIENYEHYQATQSQAPKQEDLKQISSTKAPAKTGQLEKETDLKTEEKLEKASDKKELTEEVRQDKQIKSVDGVHEDVKQHDISKEALLISDTKLEKDEKPQTEEKLDITQGDLETVDKDEKIHDQMEAQVDGKHEGVHTSAEQSQVKNAGEIESKLEVEEDKERKVEEVPGKDLQEFKEKTDLEETSRDAVKEHEVKILVSEDVKVRETARDSLTTHEDVKKLESKEEPDVSPEKIHREVKPGEKSEIEEKHKEKVNEDPKTDKKIVPDKLDAADIDKDEKDKTTEKIAEKIEIRLAQVNIIEISDATDHKEAKIENGNIEDEEIEQIPSQVHAEIQEETIPKIEKSQIMTEKKETETSETVKDMEREKIHETEQTTEKIETEVVKELITEDIDIVETVEVTDKQDVAETNKDNVKSMNANDLKEKDDVEKNIIAIEKELVAVISDQTKEADKLDKKTDKLKTLQLDQQQDAEVKQEEVLEIPHKEADEEAAVIGTAVEPIKPLEKVGATNVISKDKDVDEVIKELIGEAQGESSIQVTDNQNMVVEIPTKTRDTVELLKLQQTEPDIDEKETAQIQDEKVTKSDELEKTELPHKDIETSDKTGMFADTDEKNLSEIRKDAEIQLEETVAVVDDKIKKEGVLDHDTIPKIEIQKDVDNKETLVKEPSEKDKAYESRYEKPITDKASTDLDNIEKQDKQEKDADAAIRQPEKGTDEQGPSKIQPTRKVEVEAATEDKNKEKSQEAETPELIKIEDKGIKLHDTTEVSQLTEEATLEGPSDKEVEAKTATKKESLRKSSQEILEDEDNLKIVLTDVAEKPTVIQTIEKLDEKGTRDISDVEKVTKEDALQEKEDTKSETEKEKATIEDKEEDAGKPDEKNNKSVEGAEPKQAAIHKPEVEKKIQEETEKDEKSKEARTEFDKLVDKIQGPDKIASDTEEIEAADTQKDYLTGVIPKVVKSDEAAVDNIEKQKEVVIKESVAEFTSVGRKDESKEQTSEVKSQSTAENNLQDVTEKLKEEDTKEGIAVDKEDGSKQETPELKSESHAESQLLEEAKEIEKKKSDPINEKEETEIASSVSDKIEGELKLDTSPKAINIAEANKSEDQEKECASKLIPDITKEQEVKIETKDYTYTKLDDKEDMQKPGTVEVEKSLKHEQQKTVTVFDVPEAIVVSKPDVSDPLYIEKDTIIVGVGKQTEKADQISTTEVSTVDEVLEKQGEKDSKVENDENVTMKAFHEDSVEISKIDKKLQELKEAAVSEEKQETSDVKLEEQVKLEAQSKTEIDIVDKIELGRKSPKEREQDVAIIVASVAEVLKSDAPLEEFEGKIPLEINTYSPYTPFTTELRETHITTVESPIIDVIVSDKIQMQPIEEEKSSPKDPISEFLQEERKIASVHIDYDNLQKDESRVSSLIKDSTELIHATSKIISDIKQSSKVDDHIVIEDIKPSETQKPLDDTSVTNIESHLKSEDLVLEDLNIGEKTLPASLQLVDLKPDLVDVKADVKLDSADVPEKVIAHAKESIKDVLDIDKCSISSGKSSPDIKESRKDSIDVGKTSIPSGKSSPDVSKSKNETLHVDKSPDFSGKTTPDVNESERDSRDTLTDIKTILAEGDKLSKIPSGKSSPEIKTFTTHRADTTVTESEKTDKSASEKTTSEIKDPAAGLAKHLTDSDKTDQDERGIMKDSLDTKEALTISGKTTPEIKEPTPISSDKEGQDIVDKSSITSGKTSPDMTNNALSADRNSLASGKSTPEIIEPTKDGLEVEKSPVLSGKSTPDIVIDEDKSSVSGRQTPDTEDTIAQPVPTKPSNESSQTITDIKDMAKIPSESADKELIENDKPTSIFSGSGEIVKPQTDSKAVDSDDKTSHKLDISTVQMKEDDESGKSATDVKDISKSDKISRTFTPDIKQSQHEEESPAASGKASPDLKPGKISPTPTPDIKQSQHVEKSSAASGKASPDLQCSTTNGIDLIKTPADSERSSPDPKPKEDILEKTQESTTITSSEIVLDSMKTAEKDLVQPKPPGTETKAAQDFKVTETVDSHSSLEHISKGESVAGPSSSSKTEHLSSSKSPAEELELSRKSTPDIADIAKDKESEDSSLGRTTPPTVPVSPVVKEKRASLHEQEKEDKKDIPEVSALKTVDVRSSTPASDDCDISSGQVSRVLTTEDDDDKQVYSDDEDLPGSPMSATSQIAHSTSSQYDFEDNVRGTQIDPMSASFYGALPEDPVDLSKGVKSSGFLDEGDLDFEKALLEHRQARGRDLTSSPSHVYEITTAKYSNIKLQEEADRERKDEAASAEPQKESLMTSSFIGTELPKDPKDDPIASWGKPLGLPSPAPLNDNKGTPKKERKIPPSVMAKNKLNEDKKLSDSKYDKKGKKINPVYVDLTYVPHHGNSNYSYVDFFKRVRARYYVFSGIEPSKEVYSALLEAKQTWDDKELEVTIIPTYDTDVLGYWVAENEDLLAKYKIDLSPSASRCTINLQDHETSCSAYRLEFS